MMDVYYSSFSLIRITNGSKKLISLFWFWVLCLHVIDSAPLHLFPGGCGGLRSPASAWLVPWPAPAHACNAVCNEKSKQGTAVRHDRNVFPLEGAPCKKKKEEKKNKKKRWGRVVSRRSAHLGQSGRLMLLYIGRHSASPPSPIGSWSLYQFLLCLSRSLSLFFPRLCLLRWTVTQFWMIPPFCTHGCRLCHRVRVLRGLQRARSWSSNPGSLWMGGGAGSRGTNTRRNKTKNGEKTQRSKESE